MTGTDSVCSIRSTDPTSGSSRDLPQPRIVDPHNAEWVLDGFRFALRTHRSSTVAACLPDLAERLRDAIESKTVGNDDADLLLVQPSLDGQTIWLCAIRSLGLMWQGHAVSVQRPPSMDTAFAILNTDDQEQNVLASYQSFQDFFPEWIQPTELRRKCGMLRIKVDPKELWFLKFPLGLFVQMRLNGFELYSGCQWIVTDRTISATVAAQRSAEREIADTKAFLSGAHIIVNTYRAHQRTGSGSKILEGFTLIEEVLSHLASVPFGRESAFLRWTFNPSPSLLTKILTSQATRFLYADFEAKGNVWHIGDGVHRCSHSCCHSMQNDGNSTFDLEPLRDKLKHILLMRIYHCNSIYDPFKQRLGPVGKETLAGKLLATGATFVEGSLSEEPTLDYICELLNLLLGRSDFRTVLWGRSFERSFDLDSLLRRANALLALRGLPLLPHALDPPTTER